MTVKTHITVVINEQDRTLPHGISVGDLKEHIKPEADILVVNGFPCKPTDRLKDGDQVVFIKRGEIPKAGDLVKAAESGRGLMAPRVGVAAHHQANLVVSLLMDPENLEL